MVNINYDMHVFFEARYSFDDKWHLVTSITPEIRDENIYKAILPLVTKDCPIDASIGTLQHFAINTAPYDADLFTSQIEKAKEYVANGQKVIKNHVLVPLYVNHCWLHPYRLNKAYLSYLESVGYNNTYLNTKFKLISDMGMSIYRTTYESRIIMCFEQID